MSGRQYRACVIDSLGCLCDNIGLVVNQYEILETDVPFTMTTNPTAHVSYLKTSRVLDFENDQCFYNLTVIAYDGEGVRSTNEVIMCILYHCTMCTSRHDLVYFSFYAIPIFPF